MPTKIKAFTVCYLKQYLKNKPANEMLSGYMYEGTVYSVKKEKNIILFKESSISVCIYTVFCFISYLTIRYFTDVQEADVNQLVSKLRSIVTNDCV